MLKYMRERASTLFKWCYVDEGSGIEVPRGHKKVLIKDKPKGHWYGGLLMRD